MAISGSEETENKRREIITYMKRYIRSSQLKEGDRLPSENELAQRFATNRNTVRGALTALKGQGIVYSLKGKGFFVAERPKPLVYEHDNFLGFSEILNKGTRNFTSEVLSVELCRASETEAQKLEISAGDEVYRLRQLRTINGRRLAVCLSVLPAKFVPGLEEHTGDFAGVNHILLNVYHFPHPLCRWIHLQASLPTQKEMELLEISENVPILEQSNVFEIEGVGPIEYFIVRARGDMFHFSMEFKN